MSEAVVSVNVTENPVTYSESSEVKCTSESRCKLEADTRDVDDVSKSKNVDKDLLCLRKRKRRRGKSKRRRVKPYSRSWQERSNADDRESSKRSNSVRAKLFSGGQPVAPNNTTQFLMEDHNDLQNLDVKLQAVTTNSDGSSMSVMQRPSRARDSSLSVDSGEDYFYSSPEDEGDFLSKEFSNAYEDLHAERLNSLSKSQLIQEYLQMEAKVDTLEKRLKKTNPDIKGDPDTSDCDKEEKKDGGNEVGSLQKVTFLKQEIDKLYVENEQLRRENDRLRCTYLKDKSVRSRSESSVDSESDSTPCCRCTDSEMSCSCSSHSDSDSVESSSSGAEDSARHRRIKDVT